MDDFSMFDTWEFSEAGSELFLFQEYLRTLESFMEIQAQKHEESLKELIASGQIGYDEESGPESNYDSHMLDLLSSFEDMLRKSFFVSLYSFLEATLINECRSQSGSNNNVSVSFNDFQGKNDIDKAKAYYTRVLQLNFPSNTPEWCEIQNYKTLRNCLVHAQGRVDGMKNKDDQAKLWKFIKHKKTLFLPHYGIVIFEKGFCDEALVTIENFLRSWLYPTT
jgi:hypothetical protein